MNTEILLFCDAAKDIGGRMSILDAVDTVIGPELPVIVKRCSVVARFRIAKVEEGMHNFKLIIIDMDGSSVVNMEGNFNMRMSEGADSAGANLIIDMNNLKFENNGEHSISVAIDGQEISSIPLYVRVIKPPNAIDENLI